MDPITDVTRYRVRLQEMMPLTDPVVPNLLRLMAAVNDLRTLQNLWLLAQSRSGENWSAQEMIRAESIHVFRLTCATAYEAGIAFQHFKCALEAAGRRKDLDELPERGRSAYFMLENLFKRGFEGEGWGNVLCRLRNSVFHFAEPKVFLREAQGWSDLAEIIIGDIALASRYLIADELQHRILLKPVGVDDRDSQTALIRTLTEVMGALSTFVNEMVVWYAKTHEAAIVEEDQEKIDTATLWLSRP